MRQRHDEHRQGLAQRHAFRFGADQRDAHVRLVRAGDQGLVTTQSPAPAGVLRAGRQRREVRSRIALRVGSTAGDFAARHARQQRRALRLAAKAQDGRRTQRHGGVNGRRIVIGDLEIVDGLPGRRLPASANLRRQCDAEKPALAGTTMMGALEFDIEAGQVARVGVTTHPLGRHFLSQEFTDLVTKRGLLRSQAQSGQDGARRIRRHFQCCIHPAACRSHVAALMPRARNSYFLMRCVVALRGNSAMAST